MHAATFPVRIFDVDCFGELRSNVLLRWLWQTASKASDAVGYDLDWYGRQGTMWIIRRTRGEWLAPARSGDLVTVRTWVSDIRRVRSQREYEVSRGDALLARLATDWVYVDLARGALVQPPQALQQALMPDGVASRPRLPSLASAPPAAAVLVTRRVELADLDTLAHVNNAQYAVYVEQMAWDALAARGWPLDPRALDGRPRLAAHELEYFESAQYAVELAGAVWVTAVAPEAFTIDCQLSRGGQRALHARSTWSWPAGPLPTALRSALAALSPAPASPP